MLKSEALVRFKAAFTESRTTLIVLVATYIPAVLAAGHGGHWLFRSYSLAFIVGGVYMVWLVVIWVRILLAFRNPV